VAEGTNANTRPSSKARPSTSRNHSQRGHAPATQRRARHESADSSKNSLPENTATPQRPTASFLNGGWGDALDASAYMDISLNVVRRLTRRGDITAYRVGFGKRLIRYRRADCDACLERAAVAEPVKTS
jgi:excisionase family DNA binding protein